MTHVKTWHVEVFVFEEDEKTRARAVLTTDGPRAIEAMGTTRRNPDDVDIPEIGDEVAVARALRGLADTLLGVASEDLADVEGHQVHLPR